MIIFDHKIELKFLSCYNVNVMKQYTFNLSVFLFSWFMALEFNFNSDTSCLGECSWPGWMLRSFFYTKERILRSLKFSFVCGRPGSLVFLSSAVFSFFLRMYQIVALATPKVSTVCLISWFCFFSPTMASPVSISTTLEHRFKKFLWTSAKCKFKTLNQLQNFYQVILSWNNERTVLILPWNLSPVSCQNASEPKWDYV